MAVADEDMVGVVRQLACRSMSGHSERLPLRSPGEEGQDVSLGGRFWIQFREANSAQRDAVESAWVKDKVKRGGDIEREYGSVAVMDTLIEHNLIRDAVFPALDRKTGELADLAWPKQQGDQRKLVRPPAHTEEPGLPWPLMQILIAMAMDYYTGADTVVAELGNSSTTSASSPSETEEATSSSL